MDQRSDPTPFHLLRWFAVLSAVVIALGAAVLGWVTSSFLTEQMIRREAILSGEFVHNVLVSDGTMEFLKRPQDAMLSERFRNSITHLTNVRDVLRTNVYAVDRSVLWSTDYALIGRKFTDNHELDEAMLGKLVVESGRISPELRPKGEYEGLSPSAAFFIETYIPVTEGPGQPVVGVVEIYKAPQALTAAIHDGQQRVALAAAGGAVLLYLSLFGLVHRADRTMKRQQVQLRDAETLTLIGEMASSVAHNIRNPLASIRSSAELTLESADPLAAESSRDILKDADRISARITELLHMSQQGPMQSQQVDLTALVQQCLDERAPAFARRLQRLRLQAGPAPAFVEGDGPLLQQVLHSVLSNASEAMDNGRECLLALSDGGRHWRLTIEDQGQGMTAETISQVFRPFFTTKPKGLGLGLPLARRIVERMSGELTLSSEPGRGTTVTIELPKA